MDRGDLLLLAYLVVCAAAAGYLVGRRVEAAAARSSALGARLWELEAKERERALAAKPKTAKAAEVAA